MTEKQTEYLERIRQISELIRREATTAGMKAWAIVILENIKHIKGVIQ